MSQHAQSKVQTPVRSPFNRAVRRGVIVGDFQFDVDLQSTARDYPHRSLCLFFGYQDPSHFYYVHLAVTCEGADLDFTTRFLQACNVVLGYGSAGFTNPA